MTSQQAEFHSHLSSSAMTAFIDSYHVAGGPVLRDTCAEREYVIDGGWDAAVDFFV